MSTLGGSRGERNAKPKFSALDINRMYKNSRGETTEPSAQKNQVPRKHGMQSLGKVPSARRPPANLPSLKAETTSSPLVANSNIITGQEGGLSPTTSGSNPLKNTTAINSSSHNNNSSNLNNNSNSNILTNSGSSTLNSNNNSNNNSNSNSNTVIGGVGSKLVNNSVTSASVTIKSGGGSGGSGNNQTHYNHQKPITWSAVTTGNDHGGGQRGGKPTATVPPLYQSPQFQYEFPTLDGTVGGGGSGGNPNANRKSAVGDHRDHYHHHQNHQQMNSNHHNHYQRDSHGRHHYQQQRQDAHSYKDGNDVGGGGGSVACGDEHTRDISEVSLRPQTDAAVWLQQQEKAAKGALIGENASNHQGLGLQQNTASSANAAVPLPILALMPPFMQRGVPLPSGNISSATSGIGRSQTPPNYQNGISKDAPASSANVRPQARGALNDYRSNSPAIGSFRVSTNVPKRPNQLSTPPPANGSHDRERVNSVSGNGPTVRKEKEFIIEPEVAQMQRPIIREEDLERLNAIANDDSWTKQDEIDYTKKLTFSDEESPEEQTPVQERERPMFNKNNNSGGNIAEQRKNSNASAASSSTGVGGINNWQRKERDSCEREKSSGGPDQMEDSRHQNGHRPAGPPGSISLDAGVLERAKQRREEEERREMERKQAAARKKQELEMKMNCKKAAGDGLEQGVQSSGSGLGSANDESQPSRRIGSNNYERGQACGGGNRAYERDMRGGGDYIRGNNGSGSNSGSSVSAPGSSTGGAKSIFSAHFQSNLPPRFQRQQQMQSQQSSTSVGNNVNNSGVGRSMSGGQSLEKSVSSTSTYENTRYMQKGSASQRMSSLSGGNGRGEYRDNYPRSYGRSRNDSEREDDQRYHSGRGGRDDHPSRNMGCNQITRGASDTSQRKTSVSSNDDSIKYGGDCKEYNSAAAVSSWAEETDAEMKRQRGESFSSSHSHESTHIKILQRPHTQKSLSEEDTTTSEEPQPQQSQKQQPQQHRISESSDNQSVTFAPTQILRRSESSDDKGAHQNKPLVTNDSKMGDELPKTTTESNSVSENMQENQSNTPSTASEIQNKSHENEYINQETTNTRKEPYHNKQIESGECNVGDTSKADDQRTVSSQPQPQREQKRPSPRGGGSGGRVDRDRGDRGTHSRSFGGSGGAYRGGRDGGWNSRGGHSRGGGRYNNSSTNSDTHYLGDSEHPEEDECEDMSYGNIRRSERNPKTSRKESGGGGGRRNGTSSDERGFTPRGEPSRRGRGGGATVGDRGISSSSYRRSNDNRSGGRNYGRQNYTDHKDMSKRVSESSENNNTEVDKIKQNQLALNAGLTKALDKDCEQSRSSQSSNTSKQSPTLVAAKTQDPEKKSCTTTPCKQFGVGSSGSGSGSGSGQSRKESTSSNKNDDDHNSVGGGSERDKKSSSKEKDVPGSGLIVGTSRHIIATSTNTINSANNAASTITQPKKQDLPMTPLPIVNQGASKPMQQQQSPQLQTQPQPQHTVTKPPPGLSGTILKPAGSCASISSIGGNSQKSSTDLQKSKSDPNNSSNLSAQIREVDKNKLGSVGSLSGDSKTNSGGLIIDGAPVNTIIFENTNYKQQAQAAQMKRSSESLVSSSVVSGVNVSAASADTISTAFSQMSFGNNKPAEINSPANVTANDYDKDMKLGFSFGDATESYTSATKGVVVPNDHENKAANNVTVVTQAQQVATNINQQQQQQQQQQNAQQQQQQQQAQNIISTADLNMKIASVKKVWENVAPMVSDASNSGLQQQQQQQQLHQQQQQQQMEVVDPSAHMTAASFVAAAVAASQHQQQQQQQQHMPHYAVTAVHMQQHHSLSSPGPVPSAYGGHGSPFDAAQLEQQFGQAAASIVVGASDDTSVGYPSPQQQQPSAVQQQQQQSLKHPSEVVKQHQQVSAAAKQMQPHHSSSMGMSPPPNLQPQQQQQQHQQQSAAQQQMHAPQPFYQASPQFTGIPTIPSPPAVVFNSSQMPPPPSQGGLYAPFHSLDHSSRSQFSAAAAHSFPGHYSAAAAAAAAAAGPFNAYPMQTPPNMATAPTPEMYSNLTSQFRMGGGPSPFGNPNSQQLNNPSAAAVAIISSNSNSLMSTVGSVKPPPSSQQIGTIGSKGAGGGGPFAAAQQYMNLYAAGPPQHPQGGPPGPPPGAHQLQSNSYYSNSAGGPSGPTAFYGGPPPQGAGAGAQNYGLAAAAAAAAGLYGGHAGHQGGPPGSNGPAGPPQGPPGPQSQHTMGNFNTQFMNSQLLTAAAINQFRGGPTPQQAAAAYMKSSQQQSHLQDSMGRQLKSPLGADVSLNLVKQAQSQPSPPHHKNYASWDLQNQVMQQQAAQQQQQQNQPTPQQRSAGGSSGSNPNMNPNNRGGGGSSQGSQGPQGRYPAPIQRPTNYPQHPQQQQQQQQQQVQQAQRGGAPPNVRQGSAGNASVGSNNSAGPQGPGGSQSGNVVGPVPGGNGAGPGGPGNNGGNNAAPGGGGQSNQMNKTYYANNAGNGGPNRANHN